MSFGGRTDAVRAMRNRSTEICKFFTIADVAEITGVATRTVRRWIERGELVVHRFGAAVRITEADLKVFLALHRED